MTITSSIMFALTAYGIAALISFFVALLIKGLTVAIRLTQPSAQGKPRHIALPPVRRIFARHAPAKSAAR